MATDCLADAVMKATLESFGEVIRDGNPLKRIGSPEDVAGACIFLSSRAGAYINGYAGSWPRSPQAADIEQGDLDR